MNTKKAALYPRVHLFKTAVVQHVTLFLLASVLRLRDFVSGSAVQNSTFPRAHALVALLRALNLPAGPVVALQTNTFGPVAAAILTETQLRKLGGTDKMAFSLLLAPVGWAPGDLLSEGANVGLTYFIGKRLPIPNAVTALYQLWNPGAPAPALTPAILAAARAFLK